MTHLLRVEKLCKRFDQTTVLNDIHLTINKGEIVGLAGESGSGKSTLARCIAGLHRYDSGAVYFADELLPRIFTARDFQQQATRVQMIFQDPLSALNPRLNIADILCEPLRLNSSLSKNHQRERASYWLQKMGLKESDLARYPHSFSGGQLQRIGIARALMTQPALLICDEPLSALDVSVQAQIANLLLDLREELQLTLLFISHDPAMMNYLCDRVISICNGKIISPHH